MIRNGAGLLAVWILLPFLVGAARVAGERLGLCGEHKRKIVHVGMGLASLAFPWLFSSWIWVAILCAGCLLQLEWVRRRERRTGEASALHDIERHSLGEICFPVAVVLVFALSGGIFWRYLIPILVLTLADAAGAVIGSAYGRRKFRVFANWKSAEGSLLVFLVAFLSVHVPLLLLTELGRTETLLIAVTLAALAMLIEAVSVHGLDNFFVPVLLALLLPKYAGLGEWELLQRLAVVGGLQALVLLARRETSLEGGSLLAGVLLGYAAFAFGGWRFIVPPLILFGEHLWVTHRLRRVERVRRLATNDLWVIFGLALSFAPWLALAAWRPEEKTLALRGFVTAAAVQLACFQYTTRLFVSQRPATARTWRLSVGKAVLFVLLPGFLLSGLEGGGPALGGAALLLVPGGLWLFRLFLGKGDPFPNSRRRWLLQGSAALLCSLPIWATGRLLAS